MMDLTQLAFMLAPETPLEESSALTELNELNVVKEVLEKFTSIASECNQWHEYINRNRMLYLLWGGGDNIYDITISKPHNVVTFAKGVLLTAEYQPQAIGFVEVDEEAQSAYEKFALGIWKTQEERQEGPLDDAFVGALCVDGAACLHLYPDKDYAPKGMEVHWGENPITMEVVNSLDVYPCVSANPKRPFDYIINKYQESLHNLRNQWPDKDWNQYGAKETEDGREVGERENMIDIYNYYGYDTGSNVVQTICTDRLLLADEVMWHSSELPLPWIVEPCYTGRAPKDTNDNIILISKFQSILHPIDDDIQTAEHLLAADMRAVDLYGNMPPVLKTAGRHVKIDAEWAEVVELQNDETLGFPQWPGNPPDSSRILGYIQGDMQEASFSSAAMGFAGSSASGYHVALTTESSRTRLYLPGRSYARAIKRAGRMAAKMIGFYWPQTMFHMYGLGANGQYQTFGFHPDMADGLQLECEVKLLMPGDDVRKAAIATQHKAIGLPLDVILSDDLGYKQPDDILRKIDEEKVRQHPIVTLLRLVEMLKREQSPFVPIIEQALQKAISGMVEGAGGQMGMQSPPQFRPPGQQPNMQMMGQNVAPMPDQGFGQVPGQVPPNVPAF